ncbi:MAG TPA: acyl-CoA dehydrogenase family protein [Woeseiaceae bacterium]
MDFALTEEQGMLQDSVSRFIDNDYDFEKRQKIAESEAGYSAELWGTFAELGWTSVPFAEEDGGFGGGPIELMLMMEQFGRGLVVEPFLANVVLAGGVLRRVADAEQKTQWLSPIIDGSRQAAFAFAEPQSRHVLADVKTTALKSDDGYRLNGKKALVINGGRADFIIVVARSSGDQKDESGLSLFVVDAAAQGVSRHSYPMVDGHQAAEITLQDVLVPATACLGEAGNAFATIQSVIDEATLAVCAEASGIMQAMLSRTLEYAKNRVQFGVPIGSFQALQHRMVDMLMACEQTRSLLLWAAMVNSEGGADAARSISALKYLIGTSGRKVGQEAVQIHGGMGVSWEVDVAHYFKRLTAIEILFGNADFHLTRYIESS